LAKLNAVQIVSKAELFCSQGIYRRGFIGASKQRVVKQEMTMMMMISMMMVTTTTTIIIISEGR